MANEIQLWDFRNSKLVASKILSREKFAEPSEISHDRDPQFIRYADDGSKLILCQKGHLFVLDSDTLNQLQAIDLGKSAWPPVPPRWGAGDSYVADIEPDANATRAALLMKWGTGGGELRVYDIISGNLVRKWNFPNFDFGGISIDPGGSRVAISLLPFSPGERPLPSRVRNVFIYDVNSGEIASKFNTGYLAAEIRFVGSDTVATVSAEVGLGG
ncbi:MAG: hypothetical protein ACRD4H_04995, partial [Candidatus Acidiferrales bacterium]